MRGILFFKMDGIFFAVTSHVRMDGTVSVVISNVNVNMVNVVVMMVIVAAIPAIKVFISVIFHQF